MDPIPFLSEEGAIVQFPRDLLRYTSLLEMLDRRHSGNGPIKTGVAEVDLRLTEAICATGILPCSQQQILQPKGFQSYQDLADYMGITDIDLNDKENHALNEILSYLGLPEFHTMKSKKHKPSKKPSRRCPFHCVTVHSPKPVATEDEDGQLILNRWTIMPEESYPIYDDEWSDDWSDDW
jgi:hypothetical protein